MPDPTIDRRSSLQSWWPAFGLYGLILVAWLLGALFPDTRAGWAFSVLAFYPGWAMAAMLIGALVLGIGGELGYRRYLLPGHDGKGGYPIAAAAVSILLIAGFYFLRARTFFLGDGYTLLDLLATGNPLIEKERQLVESFMHVSIYRAMDGGSEHDAAVAYQIVSIAAGAVYLAVAAWFSRVLFDRTSDRLLLFLSLVSGGWVLLYFGYVENYSTFVLVVLLYCLTGIAAIQGRIGRWAVVVLQVSLPAFHIFGVTFIPATVYLLVHDTAVARRISRLARGVKIGVGVSLLVVIAVAFGYAWSSDLFFQIALVPLLQSPFVAEGYTLFSLSHLADFFNLLFLVLPGLLLLIVAFIRLPLKGMFREPIFRWLGLAAAGALGAAFIFDPKLGMARDWDLFSFSGVPLGVLLTYAIVSHREKARGGGRFVLLAVLLGFVGLSARAIWLATPEIGIAHFRDYLYLDKAKNRNGWVYLINYYTNHGDSTASAAVNDEWQQNFPEVQLMAQANQLFYQERKPAAAEMLLRRILRINPSYSDAYSFLGYIYLQEGRYDSALVELRRADALSPNRPNNLNNLGQTYIGMGKYDEAEAILKRAAWLDSTGFAAQYNLAQFYLSRHDPTRYMQYLEQAAGHPEAPPRVREELIVACIRRGELDRARRIYCASEAVRADSTFFEAASPQVPGIDTLLVCP